MDDDDKPQKCRNICPANLMPEAFTDSVWCGKEKGHGVTHKAVRYVAGVGKATLEWKTKF